MGNNFWQSKRATPRGGVSHQGEDGQIRLPRVHAQGDMPQNFKQLYLGTSITRLNPESMPQNFLQFFFGHHMTKL
jgi:hypothetical protein